MFMVLDYERERTMKSYKCDKYRSLQHLLFLFSICLSVCSVDRRQEQHASSTANGSGLPYIVIDGSNMAME